MNNRKLGLGAVMIALVSTIIGIGVTPMIAQASVKVVTEHNREAPIATSGDNVYIGWWTNKTGNDEVMFRASTDGGKTFGDKINLSNSTKAESQDAHIDA
jgi:hypothetical protein